MDNCQGVETNVDEELNEILEMFEEWYICKLELKVDSLVQALESDKRGAGITGGHHAAPHLTRSAAGVPQTFADKVIGMLSHHIEKLIEKIPDTKMGRFVIEHILMPTELFILGIDWFADLFEDVAKYKGGPIF